MIFGSTFADKLVSHSGLTVEDIRKFATECMGELGVDQAMPNTQIACRDCVTLMIVPGIQARMMTKTRASKALGWVDPPF